MHEETPAQPPEEPTPPPRRAGRRSTAETLRSTEFPAAMRGYDRAAVDEWRDEVADLVERLEAQQPRDDAVRRAVEEVGRDTAAILQSAHESAEEIEARSRAQAEGRLRRADRDAEATIRAAEEQAERLEADTRALWDERSRLIEEIRQLADEVLGVADDALDRLQPPAGPRSGEPAGGGVPYADVVGSIERPPGQATPAADPAAPAEDPTLEDPSEDPTLEDEPSLGEGPEPEAAAGRAPPTQLPEAAEHGEADDDLTVEAPVVDPADPGPPR